MNRSQFLVAINAMLDVPAGQPPLVSFVDFEWQMAMENDRPHGTVVIETSRPLTTEGGDGWTGIDASQMQMVHNAVIRVLIDNGAAGLWDRLVVRQASGHMTREEVEAILS